MTNATLAQNRREARRIAMTAVYAAECTGYSHDEVMTLMRGLREDWAELPEFTTHLCEAVQEHRLQIEQNISTLLQNWTFDRIAPVERSLLILGSAEVLFFDDIPPRVTINEYIELAKLFAHEQSPAFVNGILDKLVHLKGKRDFSA
jgi:N utilization substance protein B